MITKSRVVTVPFHKAATGEALVGALHRSHDGQADTAASQLTFSPGETKVFTSLWTFKQSGDEGAPKGDYRLLAKFYGATFPIRIEKPE